MQVVGLVLVDSEGKVLVFVPADDISVTVDGEGEDNPAFLVEQVVAQVGGCDVDLVTGMNYQPAEDGLVSRFIEEVVS